MFSRRLVAEFFVSVVETNWSNCLARGDYINRHVSASPFFWQIGLLKIQKLPVVLTFLPVFLPNLRWLIREISAQPKLGQPESIIKILKLEFEKTTFPFLVPDYKVVNKKPHRE